MEMEMEMEMETETEMEMEMEMETEMEGLLRIARPIRLWCQSPSLEARLHLIPIIPS